MKIDNSSNGDAETDTRIPLMVDRHLSGSRSIFFGKCQVSTVGMKTRKAQQLVLHVSSEHNSPIDINAKLLPTLMDMSVVSESKPNV
jgi:hypothetical protein